jgi:hypothetical protein
MCYRSKAEGLDAGATAVLTSVGIRGGGNLNLKYKGKYLKNWGHGDGATFLETYQYVWACGAQEGMWCVRV